MRRLLRTLKIKKPKSVSSMSDTPSLESLDANHGEDEPPPTNPGPPKPPRRVHKDGTSESPKPLSEVEEEEELDTMVPHVHENIDKNPEVTKLVEYFEGQLVVKNEEILKGTLKPTVTHKRSQLTRKRSKSFTSFHHFGLVKEEAEFQGDSIAHVILDQSGQASKKKDDGKDDKDNSAATLLKELVEFFRSKLVPPEQTTVYTVDSVQYKVSSCTSKTEQNSSLEDSVAKEALKCDDGRSSTRRRPWSGCDPKDLLNYLRSTVVDVGAECRLAEAQSKQTTSSNNAEAADKPAEWFGDKSATVLPWERRDYSSFLENQHEEYGTHSQGQSRGRPDFEANNFHRNCTVMPTIPIQHSSSTPVGNTPFHQFRTTLEPATVTDMNNNSPNLPPSTSSSDDSVLTSVRSTFRTTNVYPPSPHYQPDYPSEYAFKYRRPKVPAAAYAISNTSTRDGSILAGSISNSVRNACDEDPCRMSQASCSYRKYNENTKELSKRDVVIEDATYAVNALLSDLHTLWCCVSDKKTFPITSSKGLLELVGFCSYVVKEMEGEWRSFFYPDRKRLDELSNANRHLRERLERATLAENTLQAEISYLLKEKGMMATEVKELSMQLVSSRQPVEAQSRTPSLAPQNRSPSNCSLGFKLSMDPEAGNKAIKKREEDFNSVMEFVRVRGNDMNFYKEQLEQYDREVVALHRTIEVTKAKQTELETAYEKLTEENKTIVRERGHYEQILKLILQEKQTNGSSLYDLLQTLISKLNEMGGEASAQNVGLMEGALQAVQEQNSNYRDDVQRLKEILSKVSESCLAGKCQEEAHRASNEYTSRRLEENNAEVMELIKSQNTKYCQLQEIHDHVSESKAKLDRAYADKSRELKQTMDELSTLQKVKVRQQQKIQELQKLNMSLNREIQEQTHNVDNLNKIVSHLRSTLSEKTEEWSERVRMNGEEAIGMKDQCKWLQGQIDLLTQQLADAHERMKGHERDKGCLAQQVMNAEEERKVVDRKLQELRAAFQGDSALRKALMERNESLQVEITRLRRSKLINLDMSMNKLNEDSDYDAPPSEMSNASDLMPLFHTHPSDEKHGPKKNRFTASSGYEEPRPVASVQSACDRLSK